MADDYEKAFMGADGALFSERIQNKRVWWMMGAGSVGALMAGMAGAGGPSILPLLAGLAFVTLYCGSLALFFMYVRTAVTREHLHIQIGMFGPKIPIAAITSAKRVERQAFVRSYAGVGKELVAVAWNDGSRVRNIVLGTNDAAGLLAAIERARGGAPVAQVRVEDPDAVAATEAVIAEAEAEAEKALAKESAAR